MERVKGVEPSSPAWKAGALAVVLHPRMRTCQPGYSTTFQCLCQHAFPPRSGAFSGKNAPSKHLKDKPLEIECMLRAEQRWMVARLHKLLKLAHAKAGVSRGLGGHLAEQLRRHELAA